MSDRIFKVNQLIKKELSQIVLKEVEFPKEILVTLTRVETSRTLEDAKVFISVIPTGKEDRALNILNTKIYDIQQKLNKRLKMKIIPKIRFVKETETSQADRVEEILEQLKKEEK